MAYHVMVADVLDERIKAHLHLIPLRDNEINGLIAIAPCCLLFSDLQTKNHQKNHKTVVKKGLTSLY